MGLPTEIHIAIAGDEYLAEEKRPDGAITRPQELYGTEFTPLVLRWPTRDEFRSLIPSRTAAGLEREGVRRVGNQTEATAYYTQAQVLFTTLAKGELPLWVRSDQPFSVKSDAAITHAYFKALAEIAAEKKDSAATGITTSAAA